MTPIIEFLFPKILFHKKTEEGFECGPYISHLDTGIYFCQYDYGKIFKVTVFGIGVSITWIYL